MRSKLTDIIVTRPDGTDDFYSPDCPACLRGRAHTMAEHHAAILLATERPDELDLMCERGND